MTEKEIISQLQKLKQIKPNQDWVVFCKKSILSQTDLEKNRAEKLNHSLLVNDMLVGLRFVMGHRLAFASLVIFIVLIGVFGFAQKSMPGDTLFVIKKATENSRLVFVSQETKTKMNIERANKRLEDLTKIAESNKVDKLAPAVNEYQASVSAVAKGLTKEEDNEKVKKLIAELQKLEQKEQEVKSYGVEIGEKVELESALVQTITREIEDLRGRTLSQEQKDILSDIEEDVKNGDFSKALEKTLILTQ